MLPGFQVVSSGMLLAALSALCAVALIVPPVAIGWFLVSYGPALLRYGFLTTNPVYPCVMFVLLGELLFAAGVAYFRGIPEFARGFVSAKRHRNLCCLAIARALLVLAERSPTPRLRAALPALQAVTHDFIQQYPSSREQARIMQQRLANMTERLKNLPSPAAPPAEKPAYLPRPAQHSNGRLDNLPRARQV